ncbi:MAG: formate dehydrogenase subunit alpha [Halieaceae bacterium]|nr:formate dehydrogenase subunit alpha [Halieaceae bacterium]
MLQFYEPQMDFGTPARTSDDPTAGTLVDLTIDGVEVTVPAGTSVMRAAAEAGIKVPKLCATDSLEPFGSCRVCLVEIEGVKGYPASCTTQVAPGMKVKTQTEAIADLRRNVMELYISDHPLDCLTCPTNGDCELQDVAGEVGLRAVRYGFEGAGHLDAEKDESNPYFTFDPSKCIVCSRCVRACEETQGTFALTIQGRGFDSTVSAGADEAFMDSECVSCGACVDACPTATLAENSIIQHGVPEHSVVTTCAYCGVGCAFRAEVRGEQVVRMTPWKDGKANEGHACVKGRFAYGYTTHADRIAQPMLRNSIDEPWRAVSWEEAIEFTAQRLREIQHQHGRNAVGAITSSRCTNEEVYLLQKLVRAGFGNNNVDTCARVCHSPTGYGLKTTLGESAGTQTFASVDAADVIIVMGSNPTEAHPVFGSRLKRRLREGAGLIVIDPRRIELVDSPHIHAHYHLPVTPGGNVAVLNAMAHVILTEGLHDEAFVQARCETEAFERWCEFIRDPRHSPEALEADTGVPADDLRGAARLYAHAGNGAIYYGLGVTEHSQGSTAVMGIANLAMLTGNLGREGVGVNPMRGQNNVQGSCDMGSFPHELPGYRHLSDAATRSMFEKDWSVELDPDPGMRIPNMFDAAIDGDFRGLIIQGEDVAQSDPNTQHIEAALSSLELLVVQDLFLNETAKFAHVFLPGSTFLEKNGTFTNAERRISPVRRVMSPLAGKEDWEVTLDLAHALGCDWEYEHPSQIMDEIARLTPTFHGVSYEKLDRLGSIQWPCNDHAPEGTEIMHENEFVRGEGFFALTEYVPTDERVNRRFPLLLTTGRVLSQYNVGAQTRRTDNEAWHDEDVLEIHAHDAEERGLVDGDWAGISSRVGDTVLRVRISERVRPGVVYTTFHHPFSGANVITTDNSDWATNCPEYKVTAVQAVKVAQPSAWQARQREFDRRQKQLLEHADQA